MKNKFFFFFLLFLTIVSFSRAEFLEYEGWIYNTKNIKLDETIYNILISENADSLLLSSSILTISVDRYKCGEINTRKICYNSSSYDSDIRDYKAYLTVLLLQPDIEITRTITNNILSIGESASFTVLLTNTGEADVEDVIFREELPDNIQIESVTGAIKENKTIYWKGNINEAETKEIKYKIKSIGEFDKEIKASVQYYDGYEKKEIFSDSIRLYSTSVLDIEFESDKADYELNEEILFNITLSNQGDSDIKVTSLNIFFPEGIEIIKKDNDIVKNNNTYVWRETINDNNSNTLEFTLSQKKVGVFFIILSGEYEYKGKIYNIENLKHGFLTHNEGIELTSSLNDVEYVNSNQKVLLFLKVENKNSFSKIKEIKLETLTDLGWFDNVTYGQIDINQTVFLLNNEIKIPSGTSEKTYNIKFNVTYKMESNETYSSTLENKIIVKPIQQLIVIPTISSYNVNEEEPITIYVNIKNPGINNLKEVLVDALIPDGFIVKGATSGYGTVNKSQETKVISFVVIPEKVDQQTSYSLVFSASYIEEGNEYLVSETKEIKVIPKIPKVSVQKIISETSAYKGEMIDVSYSITNEDTTPISELVLRTTEAKEFDTYNLFLYYVPKLNPGEKITFKAEQIRPKKIGIKNTERSILFFKDKYSREFNVSSGGVSVDIKEAEINGPSIYIEKSISKNIIEAGEKTELVINLTNLGNKLATGYLTDYDKEIIIPLYNTEIFRQNISFEKEGQYVIQRSVFNYTYENNEIKAYSNDLTITVVNKSKSEEVINNVEKDILVNSTVSEKPKQNFFSKVFSWFISLFKKV